VAVAVLRIVEHRGQHLVRVRLRVRGRGRGRGRVKVRVRVRVSGQHLFVPHQRILELHDDVAAPEQLVELLKL